MAGILFTLINIDKSTVSSEIENFSKCVFVRKYICLMFQCLFCYELSTALAWDFDETSGSTAVVSTIRSCIKVSEKKENMNGFS